MQGEEGPARWKALVLMNERHGWKHSEVYYSNSLSTLYTIYFPPLINFPSVPRNTDFQVQQKGLHIRFFIAHYTDYISNHVDLIYDHAPDKPPKFSHCEKKLASTSVSFESEQGISPSH
jgi:hypothetical protein